MNSLILKNYHRDVLIFIINYEAIENNKLNLFNIMNKDILVIINKN